MSMTPIKPSARVSALAAFSLRVANVWPHALRACTLAVCSLLTAVPALAQSTTQFTYQGQLNSGGTPVSGSHDIRFSLWTAATGGSQAGTTICVDNASVTNGLFTIPLDFGAAAIQTQPRFLQIEVRSDVAPGNCNAGSFTTLSPRQSLTSAPFAANTRGLTVTPDGKVGLGGATPDRGLTMLGGVNIRDSANQGIFVLTDSLEIANAATEDAIYRYEAIPLDRHTFFSSASPSLVLDASGRVGLGLQVPEAPVHFRSLINRPGYVRLQGSRQFSSSSSPNGPRTAATVVAATNTEATWSNTDSARVVDGVNAVGTLTAQAFANVEAPSLTFSGFGFAIPADRTIVGIGVEVFTNNTLAYACAQSSSATVQVTPRSGSTVGTPLATNTLLTGTSQVVVGGQGQVFGTTWTPALVNSANFGISLVMRSNCSVTIQTPFGNGSVPCSCPPTGQFRVDGVRVTVYTSTSGVATESFNWSMGYSPGQSTFALAPTADLSNAAMSVTTDGRVGIGVVPDGTTPVSTRLLIAGTVQCASLIETSTERFKTDVAAMESPLDAVLALRPVQFRWDAAHGGQRDIGLLAEQVREVVPELVASGAMGEATGLNYGRVGVLAVGAIQSQQRTIEAQRLELQALASKNADLAARLERLEGALRKLETGRGDAPRTK